MERMELNLPQLQFLFNVIAITATASLALICILLKRDKNKLTSNSIHGVSRTGTSPA